MLLLLLLAMLVPAVWQLENPLTAKHQVHTGVLRMSTQHLFHANKQNMRLSPNRHDVLPNLSNYCYVWLIHVDLDSAG